MVGFLAYTGFMLLRALIQLSDMVLSSDHPLAELGQVVVLSLPHIAVLTVPVALLLGVLIGVGRLSADSELIALKASGLDLVRLYRPIGLLATVCLGICLYLMLEVVPRANERIYEKKLQLATVGITQRIQPGVFSPEVGGRRIYVERASADHRSLQGLLVSDRSNPSQGDVITVARSGQIELDEAQGRLWLRMDQATTHRSGPDPREYETSSIGVQRALLMEAGAPSKAEKPFRALDLADLLDRALSAPIEPERRAAWVEIHKKFALPFACLVFGFLGLPLGIVNRRGGRAAGFAVSVAVVLGYYVLLAGGEAKAFEGATSPATAMWLPNGLLACLAAAALIRVRREKSVFPSLGITLPRFPWSGPSRGRVGGAAPVSAASSPASSSGGRIRVAWLLDRYVAGGFLRVFLLVTSSIIVLYLVIDYMEISDDIAKNQTPLSLVLSYFRVKLSPILLDVVPFGFLVAALVSVAGLVRSSETTALLSSGISLFRATASILLLAAVAGIGLFIFSDRVAPQATAEAERLRHVILKHQNELNRGLVNVWWKGESGRFFSAETFDPETRTLTGFSAIVIDPVTSEIIRRTGAQRAQVLEGGKGLVLTDGWVRTFRPTPVFGRQEGRFVLEAPEASTLFRAGRTDPRQMSTAQLTQFIDVRRRAGADVATLMTGYHSRAALAFAPLLLTMVGLPFSFRYGKKGAVAGLGVAILLGIGYLFLSQALLERAGEMGSLAPALAAWGADVLFGIAAAYGLLGVRT